MPTGVYDRTAETKAKMAAAQTGNHKARSVPIGSTRITNGYVMIKTADEPREWDYEHRVVMARHIGRPLTDEEVVHHGPGGKTDNRVENLTLFDSQHAHIQYHVDLRRHE
jgi:hypothetical protein